MTLPLAGVDATAGNFRTLSLTRIDGKCVGKDMSKSPLEGIVKSTLANSLGRIGPSPQISAARTYKIGKHEMVAARGIVHQSKVNADFNVIIACTLVENNVVCWQFLSTKPEATNAMATHPVKFDGEAAAPVVPGAEVAALKLP